MNIKDLFFVKEAEQEIERLENRKDWIIALTLVIPAISYLIANLLLWR